MSGPALALVVDRSSRMEVRNPILALPGMQKLMALSPAERDAVEAILRDISKDAQSRAELAWRRHKGPMAAYWKAVGVYAKHTARAIAKGRTP